MKKQFGVGSSFMSRRNCPACGKVVYPLESLKAGDALYHKLCFKCKNPPLSVSNLTFLTRRWLHCSPQLENLQELLWPNLVFQLPNTLRKGEWREGEKGHTLGSKGLEPKFPIGEYFKG